MHKYEIKFYTFIVHNMVIEIGHNNYIDFSHRSLSRSSTSELFRNNHQIRVISCFTALLTMNAECSIRIWGFENGLQLRLIVIQREKKTTQAVILYVNFMNWAIPYVFTYAKNFIWLKRIIAWLWTTLHRLSNSNENKNAPSSIANMKV